MTTHLSVRLAWHDRGWDGCVCDAPEANGSCIAIESIRESRNDAFERENAGVHLAELPSDSLPPCSASPGAFAPRGFQVLHTDPLERDYLRSVEEDAPAFSSFATPYRWMREEYFREIVENQNLRIGGPARPKERGWVSEPGRQERLLAEFWGRLEPKRSLLFYYTKENPVDEQATRLLVGVGRLSEMGPQLHFGSSSGGDSEYPVWTRWLAQEYPQQGVRIPYQEYLKAGHSVNDIACPVPPAAMLPFSYVAEHVSDDIAVAVLERAIRSIQRVRDDGLIEGDWDDALDWLDAALGEVWLGRGAFPGAGSVLKYLGHSEAFSYQRTHLAGLSPDVDISAEIALALDGKPHSLPSPGECLARAAGKWKRMPSRQDLLRLLMRFELTPDQVQRIVDPEKRASSGITAEPEEIVANPYLLAEQDQGLEESHAVGLEAIDQGMLPEGQAFITVVERIAGDDPRRVRAVAVDVLRSAGDAGDTVLSLSELVARVRARFPSRRECIADVELMLSDADYYEEVLWVQWDSNPQVVALRTTRELEQAVAESCRAMLARPVREPLDIDWKTELVGRFGEPVNELQSMALREKAEALAGIERRAISVLTGGAGTGKTSVVKVLLDGLATAEGKEPILLLAPTGKARVKLSNLTRRNAMTAHQFLMGNGWLNENFGFRTSSTKPGDKSRTIIIDECSMFSVDLLGTVLRAINLDFVRRIIFVGDPFQLPPIGPGRPFVDLIDWLRREHPEAVHDLATCMRVDENDPDRVSAGLALAGGYRGDDVHAGDDEILSALALHGRAQDSGLMDDVRMSFWNDYEGLSSALKEVFRTEFGIADGDYSSFNASLGIDHKNWVGAESWQVLSPTRVQIAGTNELNRAIQREYRRGLIEKARRWKKPAPFGDQEIVYCDKVMQRRNTGKEAWPREARALNYVANGEIGIAANSGKGDYGGFLDVAFSTQPDVTYRYYGSSVEENLELAYALTVHKAQGSDFDSVVLILPREAGTLSRELVYTALTRFRKRIYILAERDIGALLRFRDPGESDTYRRSTNLFELLLHVEGPAAYRPEGLIHRTQTGIAVRSKSEVIVADTLTSLGLEYDYEAPLHGSGGERDFRLPDFTVAAGGVVYYWEHLGMLSIPSYADAWRRKEQWYKDNGLYDRLIVSTDNADGGIHADEIMQMAKSRLFD